MKKLLCLSTALLLSLSLTTGCFSTVNEIINELTNENLERHTTEPNGRNVELDGDSIRIGNAEFGFISVPADTFTADFMDIGYAQAGIPHIGFKCLSDLSIIVSVNTGNFGDDIRLGLILEVMGFSDFERVRLGGFDAYRTYTSFPDGISVHGWFFFDDDSNVRHISATGPHERGAELIGIVEGTFSFEE